MEVHGRTGVLVLGPQPEDVNGGLRIGRTRVGVHGIAGVGVDLGLYPRSLPPNLRDTFL